MLRIRPTGHLLLVATLGVLSITCTGDITPPGEPGRGINALAGPAARITVSRQPPAGALDQEVWAPGSQPLVVVKDAAGVAVPGVAVTVRLASGTGTLQGALSATTRANGSATFADLGIAGTGTYSLAFATGSVSATSSSVKINPLPVEATTGSWDPKIDWDIVPLHIQLLPSKKVLAWGKFEPNGSMGMPRLWTPGTDPVNARMLEVDTMLFCSGHTLMADGRVIVSGGHKADTRGIADTHIFDPATESWVPGLPKMAKGRWYPTVTTLPNGRVVTVAGRDASSTVVSIPEIWENNRWVQLPGAKLTLPYYPRDFVAPNGKIFYAGELIRSRYLDVDGSTTAGRGKWSTAAGFVHVWKFNRDYGSAVMYEPGKIIYVGGGGDPNWSTTDPKASAPTATAEVIDLNVTGAKWTNTGAMHYARRHLNATILPDGQVLATGGTRLGGFNNLNGAVHAAEVWDPKTGQWTELAPNAVNRGYHSVSLLLPDATVLHGASGDASGYPAQKSHEIFRPPYLFKGARPGISSLSKSNVGYGETFDVNTPNAAQITAVRWIRLGAVTHAFDASQRANTLKFNRLSGKVRVTAPSSSRLAPPGPYLLFILNRNNVPSSGAVVQVR